jgi:hypothetical protein
MILIYIYDYFDFHFSGFLEIQSLNLLRILFVSSFLLNGSRLPKRMPKRAPEPRGFCQWSFLNTAPQSC